MLTNSPLGIGSHPFATAGTLYQVILKHTRLLMERNDDVL